MKLELAEQMVEQFKQLGGPLPTIEELISMTKVQSDDAEVYAFHVGKLTFLAWVQNGICREVAYYRW